MEATVPITLLSVFLLALAYWFSKWMKINRNPMLAHRLPPGSDGFPFIGETLSLLLPATDFHLIPFLKTRIQRYGPIFRTNLFGRQMVVSADSDFNHFLLQREDKLIEEWYTDNLARIFTDVVNLNVPSIHKYVRSSTIRSFGVQTIKDKLLPEIEQLVHDTLDEWSSRPSVEVKYASASMILEYGAKQTFGYDPRQSEEKLIDLYCSISKGLISVPFSFPGTTHYKCLKGKEKVVRMIKNEMKRRQADSQGSSSGKGDFLDHAMEELNNLNPNSWTEDFIVNLVFGINFVNHDTISMAMTLAVKLIEQHPPVLQELVAEHEGILKGRRKGNEFVADQKLSWSEYKSMAFTLQVINETLRLGNISPGLLRKAKEDIQINGYTIPAGTGILIATTAVHLNAQTYEDPLTFNPWRWKGKSTSEMYKDFMPFGWGTKQCAGSENARFFLATFLHVLVTKYSWKTLKGGGIRRNPMLSFGQGLHVKFTRKTSN